MLKMFQDKLTLSHLFFLLFLSPVFIVMILGFVNDYPMLNEMSLQLHQSNVFINGLLGNEEYYGFKLSDSFLPSLVLGLLALAKPSLMTLFVIWGIFVLFSFLLVALLLRKFKITPAYWFAAWPLLLGYPFAVGDFYLTFSLVVFLSALYILFFGSSSVKLLANLLISVLLVLCSVELSFLFFLVALCFLFTEQGFKQRVKLLVSLIPALVLFAALTYYFFMTFDFETWGYQRIGVQHVASFFLFMPFFDPIVDNYRYVFSFLLLLTPVIAARRFAFNWRPALLFFFVLVVEIFYLILVPQFSLIPLYLTVSMLYLILVFQLEKPDLRPSIYVILFLSCYLVLFAFSHAKMARDFSKNVTSLEPLVLSLSSSDKVWVRTDNYRFNGLFRDSINYPYSLMYQHNITPLLVETDGFSIPFYYRGVGVSFVDNFYYFDNSELHQMVLGCDHSKIDWRMNLPEFYSDVCFIRRDSKF